MASQGWDFNSFNTWWEGWTLWKESGPTIQTLVFLPSLPLTSCVTLGSSSNFSGGRKEVGVIRPSEEKGRERERHHWYLGSVSLWQTSRRQEPLMIKKKKKWFVYLVCFVLAVVHGLSCPPACGILVPQLGIKPASSTLEGTFLITGPPGKVPNLSLFYWLLYF